MYISLIKSGRGNRPDEARQPASLLEKVPNPTGRKNLIDKRRKNGRLALFLTEEGFLFLLQLHKDMF